MEDATRTQLLSSAEELFDIETLHNLAASVKEARQRRNLRFWQEEILDQLSAHTGIKISGKKQFIDLFNGTLDRFTNSQIEKANAEVDEAKRELKREMNKMVKSLRGKLRGSKPEPPRALNPPRNTRAQILRFEVAFSIDKIVDALEEKHERHRSPNRLHDCCELIRARDLGGSVSDVRLDAMVGDSISKTIKYFDVGDIRIDGWYRYFSDSLFLCAYFGLGEEIRDICKWATTRKRPEPYGKLDYEIQKLYLVMASLFHVDPAKGFGRILKNCEESKSTKIRLLAKMVDAIRRGDQLAFNDATKKAVQNHRKRKLPDLGLALLSEWFPKHVNAAYQIGLHLGMEVPDLADANSAYLNGYPGID